jgi:hypothetical protein
MIRGRRLRRIAGVACACVACVAVAGGAPTTAGAQSAVDEYTLDIPGGGGSGSGQNAPPPAGAAPSGAAPSEAAASGAASPSAGTSPSQPGSDSADVASARRGNGSSGARNPDTPSLEFDEFHSGVTPSAGKPDPRSALQVVADTLLDGPMLLLLGALVLITGVGAWRVFRHGRTLSGAPG